MRIGTPYQLKKKITIEVKIFLNYFEFICGVGGIGAKKGFGRKIGAQTYTLASGGLPKRLIHKKA